MSRGASLVVLQPGYLPWLGFFNQVLRSDIFIFYDDVQYDKHGWRNRNRIKSPGGPHWLTVPVLHHGKEKPEILDIEINNDVKWAKKHLGTIEQWYRKAPYFDQYMPGLRDLLSRPWTRLLDLNLELNALLCGWLGIRREFHRSSALGIEGGKSERLVNLCRRFGAKRYLSGNAAKSYLDTDLFEHHGIEVEWQDYAHPVYPQLHGNFVPYLSVLDLLLNVGEHGAEVLGR